MQPRVCSILISPHRLPHTLDPHSPPPDSRALQLHEFRDQLMISTPSLSSDVLQTILGTEKVAISRMQSI